MTNLINHLWQSTVFAAAAWALTLALKKNRASLRYGIWLAASCKFLIPFSALVAIGNQFEWRTASAPAPSSITMAIDQVARPLAEPVVLAEPAQHNSSSRVPAVLLAVWLSGCAVCAFSWFRQWRRARAVVRQASVCGSVGGVQTRSSPARIEPGIFGIFRPVLLIPHGLEDRLSAEQIRAIIAHELAHVRRRDNLTAAVHMLVETIFWFHPAVWLIRAKLAEERERACDEAVLRESVEPEVYAEGILNVCRYYLEPRLACVSGVSGSDLRKRIEMIMGDRVTRKLNLAKRALLTAAASAALAGPFLIGFFHIPAMRAQSQAASFEVASVKANLSGEGRTYFNFEPGRFRATNLPLLAMIAIAYDLPFQSRRLVGAPEWTRNERFDVEGKAEITGLSAKAREAKMRLMLQNLLADRFKLKIRTETREVPIYALTVAKNGPKLKKADIEEKDCPEGAIDNNSCHVINGGRGRGLHARAADMSDVVVFVGNWTDRPLVDKTGLTALYQLDTEGWADTIPRQSRPDGQLTAEDIAAADPTRPTLFMLFEKLGLKMEGQKGPVEIFAIEHVERPAEN